MQTAVDHIFSYSSQQSPLTKNKKKKKKSRFYALYFFLLNAVVIHSFGVSRLWNNDCYSSKEVLFYFSPSFFKIFSFHFSLFPHQLC